MKNSDLARAFAEGATKGKANNMFIDGDTIYSYGYHFPLATNVGEDMFLVNSDKYSQSTSRHQYHVKSALSSKFTTPVDTSYLRRKLNTTQRKAS